MALANVGVLMATEGHRVLLVDWDLEAPGLEVFFRHAGKLHGDPSATPGIVDLLDAQAQGTPLIWHECLLKAEFFGHSLDILSAGRRTDDYRQRVQQLDWATLFREHRIGNYINSLREEWRHRYEFILIDSRTGMTDIGDICTVILPDVLVLFFITNYQNVEGIKSVMARAVKARSKLPVNRSKLLGVPVPARDERDRESDKFKRWEAIFASEFRELYREWLPKEIEPVNALHHIYIPYIAGWSFGEQIPVIESERERVDPSSLGAAYARLATLLSHRLDWTAIEARATTADVLGTRVELAKAREAAREGEIRLLDAEAKRAEVAERAMRRQRYFSLALSILVVGSLITTWLWKKGYDLDQAALKIQSLVRSIHVPPQMVQIPGGTFQMGDVEKLGEPWRNPVHPVKIKPFAMGQYEVTFEEYDRYAIAEGKPLPGDQGWGRERRPVINVSWDDAKAYAAWLSEKTRQRYRLPTESEWEYAARNGAKQDIWAGTSEESALEEYAVFAQNSGNCTAEVGTKKANGFGFHDLSGNVFEWVEDCLHGTYERAPMDDSAW